MTDFILIAVDDKGQGIGLLKVCGLYLLYRRQDVDCYTQIKELKPYAIKESALKATRAYAKRKGWEIIG